TPTPDVPPTSGRAVPDVPATAPMPVPDVPGRNPQPVPDVPAREPGELGEVSPNVGEVAVTTSVSYRYDERLRERGTDLDPGQGLPPVTVPVAAEDADHWAQGGGADTPLIVTLRVERDGETVVDHTGTIPFFGQLFASGVLP
ncbi:MAG TPA: hypothetical protein VNZ52_15805, partial [Candidatus Thermoplasmatota archaeon]|nr:hypothetical protein [Candidatus Thermoplasmatota archaeon]